MTARRAGGARIRRWGRRWRVAIGAGLAVLAGGELGCQRQPTTSEAALHSLSDTAFSRQYTSAFWDDEWTKQSTLWKEARAYCHIPVHRLAPNCRVVNAIVEETNPADDEEAVALVREALRAQDRRHERQAWEGLGFGDVMRPEPRATTSQRWEPAAKDSVHAPRE